jgi:putative permease
MNKDAPITYRQLARLVFLAAAVGVALWVAHSLLEVILVFFLALIIGIVLNAPVVWLETKRVPRPAGATLVLLILLGLVVGIAYLVVPRLIGEFSTVFQNLPTYAQQFGSFLARTFHDPSLAQRFVIKPGAAGNYLSTLLPRIGRFSLSLLPTLIVIFFLVSMTLYLVFSPRSVIRTYVESLPPRTRQQHMNAFTRGSQLVVGWLWSNVILGVIQAITAGVFLYLLGIPGALVWAFLALFAELIPVLGAYIMAVPPVIVAFATSPTKGIWVIMYYVIFNIVKDYALLPLLRNVTMQLNPVYLLFFALAMTYRLGILGAIVAVPLAGFAKAYYDEFYMARQKEEPHIEEKLDAMVRRETVEAGMPGGPTQKPGKAEPEKTHEAMKQEEKGPKLTQPEIAEDAAKKAEGAKDPGAAGKTSGSRKTGRAGRPASRGKSEPEKKSESGEKGNGT